MAVFVDTDRLLAGLARTLKRSVLPHLTDPSARFATEKAIEMLALQRHRDAAGAPPVDPAAARAMADEIGRLTAGTVPAGDGDALVAILGADSRFYREDAEGYHRMLVSMDGGGREEFALPSEADLTAVLRRWSGDGTVTARLRGRAVGGYSKQTLFIDMMRGDVVERQVVMRRDLPFASADRSSVVIEYPVLKALAGVGFPVPEPLLLEADPAVLGSAFLLSAHVPGRLYGTSLGLREPLDCAPEEMLGKLLARLHTIDPATLDLAPLPGSATDLASQQARIAEWEWTYRAHVETPSAALEIGLAWLTANAHLVAHRHAIVHGDLGFHNLLIEDGEITALVDWELVHLANPAEDLAYVSECVERPDLLLEHYVRHGGVMPSEAEMQYCRIFGCIRNSVLGTTSMAQFNRGDHDDVAMLPIVLHSYWTYVGKLERALSDVITAHGFRWPSSSAA